MVSNQLIIRKKSISDVFEIISGGTPERKVSEYWGGEIPWISVKDFNDKHRFILETEEFLTDKGLQNSSTNILQKNDVIISARGTVGKINMIRTPMSFNQSCYGLRAKQNIDPTFGYFALKNSVRQLLAQSYGSVFSTITIKTFDDVKIPVFSMEKQKAIANLLSSFDDKIENNNKIIANLEEQAQAIFKSWFVDFEPFQEGEFQESELGKIPLDWKVTPLEDLSIITMGQSPKSEYYNTEKQGYPFMQGNTTFGTKFGKIEKSTTKANRFSDFKDILISVRAPVGDMNINIFDELAIGRGLSAITPPENIHGYIYYYLKSNMSQIISQGTGTVFSSINKKNLTTFSIALPNDNEAKLKQFVELAKKTLDLQINLFKQNTKLAKTRDTLLPKLMSGEVRVPTE